MNAVNLIPADARRRRASLPTSPATLAVFAGLVLALIGAVAYVSAANQVGSRRSELSRVSAAASAWNAAAARYSLSVQDVQRRQQQLGEIRQLAAARYPWSELLTEIGGLMPRDAALSSLQAAAGASTAGASQSTGTSPTSTPASGASTTAGTAPTAGAGAASSASAPPVPAVQLSGCAATQSAVADTMVHLRRITGVTDVSLSSSASSAGGTAAAPTSSTSGGCRFPVQFQVSLTFSSPPAAGSAGSPGGSPPASGSAGSPAGSSPTTAASTPTAATATPTTVAAQ